MTRRTFLAGIVAVFASLFAGRVEAKPRRGIYADRYSNIY